MSIKNDYNKKYKEDFYKENLNWKTIDIAKLYKYENPNWGWEKCKEKARAIYKELKKLNMQTFRNDKIFFEMNTPFSYFDTRDSEFSNIYHDWDSE